MKISRILVANRGEVARRVFRTCREMGIDTVAVYSEPDSGEPHMREADEAVLLPAASPADTYLNVDAILAAAKETGADAIHPGYGFLSENAEFARAVDASGLTWIGPSPESIEVMGSKLASKELVESVGVPTLRSVSVSDAASTQKAAERIGFPVLVKASAGGGGKGMRIVGSPSELLDGVDSARREALGAFGDDTVFIEKYLEEPRHIEIQVFGDKHGHILSLYERECSIQRRHQKIIEECPSPGIDPETRRAMSAAAVEVARAVDYVGAGTVEFLYQRGSFFFLEMNTRLQVEHPVTEMVTGLDLVRLQIEVASGEALPGHAPEMNGHAIEARLYAEDPLNDFLPVTGPIHRFELDEPPGLRVDAGVEDGSGVTVYYDPMIAKVIAHAPTRQSAASLLASTLRRAMIHGPTTNRALLVRVLEHPDFLAGAIDTHFLDRHRPKELGRSLTSEPDERLSAVAAALADQAMAGQEFTVLTDVPSGWRNSPSQQQHRAYQGHHARHDVYYSIDPEGFDTEGVGRVTLQDATPFKVTISVDGTAHHFTVDRYDQKRFVDSELGPVELDVIPRFPLPARGEDQGSLFAPMPGRVVRVNVEVGDVVRDGDVLVVLEAMKMEHALRSPHSGTVTEVQHRAGDQVEAETLLVVVEEA